MPFFLLMVAAALLVLPFLYLLGFTAVAFIVQAAVMAVAVLCAGGPAVATSWKHTAETRAEAEDRYVKECAEAAARDAVDDRDGIDEDTP